MKHLTFYLDFISPYAFLAFETLPQALKGLSYSVSYKPVLFAGMLKHHGQLGPAEITPKRDWTYRHVLWLAQQHGIAFQMPQSHPFNPLGLLRLSLACGLDSEPGSINRHVCETIFRHVWQSGLEAGDPQRLDALTGQLAAQRRFQPEEARSMLTRNTADAIAAGVFGVPAYAVEDKVFWGFDALPMLRACLLGDPWFDGAWHSVASVAQGIRR